MNEYAEYFALIRANDFEGAKAYLAVNPAAANARDNTGVPAVLRAMQTGDDDFCRWIIEQSLSKLNETDPDGATALHYAAAKGSPELLRYLVERVGWDPLRGDCKGRTPYGIAHAAGNTAGEAYFAEAVGAAWDNLYANPVLPGFRPDPSIVRVGEDYYMVNSSFTWFPAIPISHSRDLVHWEPVGHVLTDPENAMLQGLEGGHGYWAPDISYYNGRFYVTATLRRNDDHPRPRAQIVTSAPAPEGPWDPPAVIEENGIDPSLFTDSDGKRYMVLNRGARLLPLTPDARAAAGPARLLWYGDIKRASEGPHILQKDGWYYIIMAEGGTGMTHQISVGRARTLDGPYESCPYDPILHQYDPNGTLQKSGHGDLVETQNGQWYAVYLCARPQDGFSPLGRETALDPVEWTADGWPIINRRKGPSALQRRPDLPRFVPHAASFDPADARSLWVSPRLPADAAWDGHTLSLRGDVRDLDDKATKAGIYTRQTALQCSFSARLDTVLRPGWQAGITGYYDEKSYCKFGLRGTENGTLAELTVRSPEGETVVRTAPAVCGALRMEADGLTRRFYLDDTLFAELPRAEFLADEGRGCQKRFTGSMMGLYAIGADFTAKFGELAIENYMFDWTL